MFFAGKKAGTCRRWHGQAAVLCDSFVRQPRTTTTEMCTGATRALGRRRSGDRSSPNTLSAAAVQPSPPSTSLRPAPQSIRVRLVLCLARCTNTDSHMGVLAGTVSTLQADTDYVSLDGTDKAKLDIRPGHPAFQVVPVPDQPDTKGLTIDGTVYRLLQFHFHSPSEHTIDGLAYPLEMHMVRQRGTSSSCPNDVN